MSFDFFYDLYNLTRNSKGTLKGHCINTILTKLRFSHIDLNEKLNLLEKLFQKSLALDVMKNYILK